LVIIGCKKIPFDDRNKYIGNYHFIYNYYSWSGSTMSPVTYEEYDGRVYYNKSESKDIIKIEFAPDKIFEFTYEEGGTINICGGSGLFATKKDVSFEYLSSSCPGSGLGGGIKYNVIGQKK